MYIAITLAITIHMYVQDFFLCFVAADLNVVLQRLSSRSPILQNASQLKSAIGLKDYSRGTTADLKQIVRQGINEKPGFRLSDLVSGLLLTPMLGRYVALLLPYCKFMTT